jgi:glycosyltransferase involved in cell wall biosynthesis
MRVLLITHYFPPEVGAPQARLSEMARTWAEDGADVTVLTGMPNHPTGVIPEAYRRAVLRRERIDGYQVLRTWLYATPNEGFLKKALGHLSFMVTSVLLGAWRVGRVDVVVVSSPTFFSIASAWLLSKIRGARLVVEVRDLWPAIFVELGVLTNLRLIGLLERLELAAYGAADVVVVVSEGFRDNLLRRGVPEGKVHVIRNGVDLSRFGEGTAADPKVRASLGAKDGHALVLYLGAHGISQGLSAVVDAAALMSSDPIHFAFVGEGADKKRLAERVAELGLSNVTLLPAVPRDDVPGLLAAADVCLVPLRDVPLFSTFIPSKLFEYLAAGKAVAGSVRGETARILRDAGAVVVEPEQPDALAKALRTLCADSEARVRMGESGRAYVAEHFDRQHLARRYSDLLSATVRRST